MFNAFKRLLAPGTGSATCQTVPLALQRRNLVLDQGPGLVQLRPRTSAPLPCGRQQPAAAGRATRMKLLAGARVECAFVMMRACRDHFGRAAARRLPQMQSMIIHTRRNAASTAAS